MENGELMIYRELGIRDMELGMQDSGFSDEGGIKDKI